MRKMQSERSESGVVLDHRLDACPICSQTSTDVYLEDQTEAITRDFVGSSRTQVSPGRILRCKSCGFGFRQLRPTLEHLAELYRIVDSGIYESEQSGRARAASGYFRMVQHYMPAPMDILDIGCASGLFLRCAKDASWRVTGIEPNVSLAMKAREILGQDSPIHNTTLEAAGLTSESFDVVTMWDLLEHVADPTSFLTLAASLLKPGGFLFAKVPNLSSLQARIFRSRWPLLLPEHLNYFNRETLHMCGNKAGLHWISSSEHSVAFSIGYIFYRLQQHHVPGAGMAHWLSGTVGLRDVIIPIRIGEICGIWKR